MTVDNLRGDVFVRNSRTQEIGLVCLARDSSTKPFSTPDGQRVWVVVNFGNEAVYRRWALSSIVPVGALSRSDLWVGAEIRNTHPLSGKVGEVRSCSDYPGQLRTGANWCVAVRFRTEAGERKGVFQYPYWRLRDVELVGAV